MFSRLGDDFGACGLKSEGILGPLISNFAGTVCDMIKGKSTPVTLKHICVFQINRNESVLP